jgi:hypothetical protein
MFPRHLSNNKIIKQMLDDNEQNARVMDFIKLYLSECKRKNRRVNKCKNKLPDGE